MKVNIFECGPRDGWQNLKELLPIEEKKTIIDGLVEAGVSILETTSFVSPKAIPQMADAAELAQYVISAHPELTVYALVPNYRGVQNAWNAGVKNLTYVISVSESHNKANINRTHEQSLEELSHIYTDFPDANVCVALATAFGCPFEGIPTIESVINFTARVYALGARSICLADTIGIADPRQVRETIAAAREKFPDVEWQVHIHDTRGMGMASTLAAIESGVNTVQSTLGGLGGCPFAPGASGNTATEDLVYMLERMGYDTGIDFNKLLALSKYQHEKVHGIYSGHQMNISANCCL
jgi:hydroxymethylglutaryl-CoA lyase